MVRGEYREGMEQIRGNYDINMINKECNYL